MLKGFNSIRTALDKLVRGHQKADGLDDQRRLNQLIADRARMTGGNGFREFPKPIRVYPDGTTRGERKRKARDLANARVSEARAPEFRHSRYVGGAA